MLVGPKWLFVGGSLPLNRLNDCVILRKGIAFCPFESWAEYDIWVRLTKIKVSFGSHYRFLHGTKQVAQLPASSQLPGKA